MKAFMENEDNIIIQVIDNGYGISKDVIDKFFIPFYTTKEKGTGIGLSIFRQIMQFHSGKIKVNSNPGIKTIITLEF